MTGTEMYAVAATLAALVCATGWWKAHSVLRALAALDTLGWIAVRKDVRALFGLAE